MKSAMKKLEGEVQKLSNENAALLKLLESAGASKVVSLAKKSK